MLRNVVACNFSPGTFAFWFDQLWINCTLQITFESRFILNGVCVILRGILNCELMTGSSTLHFDEERAAEEELHRQQAMRQYGDRIQAIRQRFNLPQRWVQMNKWSCFRRISLLSSCRSPQVYAFLPSPCYHHFHLFLRIYRCPLCAEICLHCYCDHLISSTSEMQFRCWVRLVDW